VQTLAGRGTVLMRLGDAVEEVEPIEGAQVHRSHWVAWDQVTAVERAEAKVSLIMAAGPSIPVSRNNRDRLMERGAHLVPKNLGAKGDALLRELPSAIEAHLIGANRFGAGISDRWADLVLAAKQTFKGRPTEQFRSVLTSLFAQGFAPDLDWHAGHCYGLDFNAEGTLLSYSACSNPAGWDDVDTVEFKVVEQFRAYCEKAGPATTITLLNKQRDRAESKKAEKAEKATAGKTVEEIIGESKARVARGESPLQKETAALKAKQEAERARLDSSTKATAAKVAAAAKAAPKPAAQPIKPAPVKGKGKPAPAIQVKAAPSKSKPEPHAKALAMLMNALRSPAR